MQQEKSTRDAGKDEQEHMRGRNNISRSTRER
jgi:hypothetical protein